MAYSVLQVPHGWHPTPTTAVGQPGAAQSSPLSLVMWGLGDLELPPQSCPVPDVAARVEVGKTTVEAMGLCDNSITICPDHLTVRCPG